MRSFSVLGGRSLLSGYRRIRWSQCSVPLSIIRHPAFFQLLTCFRFQLLTCLRFHFDLIPCRYFCDKQSCRVIHGTSECATLRQSGLTGISGKTILLTSWIQSWRSGSLPLTVIPSTRQLMASYTWPIWQEAWNSRGQNCAALVVLCSRLALKDFSCHHLLSHGAM